MPAAPCWRIRIAGFSSGISNANAAPQPGRWRRGSGTRQSRKLSRANDSNNHEAPRMSLTSVRRRDFFPKERTIL